MLIDVTWEKGRGAYALPNGVLEGSLAGRWDGLLAVGDGIDSVRVWSGSDLDLFMCE